MLLRDRVVLVTGASSGIGRACAQEFAARGARLLLSGRDTAALSAVVDRTGGRALPADLAVNGAAAALAGAAEEVHGRVDVLVLNAGIGWAGPFTAMEPLDVDGLIDVNLRAPLHLARALVPGMVERRSGHVVVVGSVAAVGVREEAVYAATKAAVATFGESLRYELAGTGVGVTVVVPGVVATSFFTRRNRGYDRAWPRPMPAEVVARRLVTAVERGRADVVVPRWLTIPIRLRGAVPAVYRAAAGRFG